MDIQPILRCAVGIDLRLALIGVCIISISKMRFCKKLRF